jgi:hypothetical protein|tara:strand:+ start:213 stop:593 length:381 start_codon:yes stop_codon:yes gene_type:complete
MTNNIGIISCSLGKSYTGSFIKLLCPGVRAATNNVLSGSIVQNVEVGYYREPLPLGIYTTAVSPSVKGDPDGSGADVPSIEEIEIPAGSYFDGPINAFKVKASTGGPVLAYFDTQYPLTTDDARYS